MKKIFSKRIPRDVAFTLVEVLVGATIGVLVLGGVIAVFLMISRSAKKSELLEDAVADTRHFQEHLTRQIGLASTLPTLEIQNEGNNAYARMRYRIPVGSVATARYDAPITETKIELYLGPGSERPAIGDYIKMGTPNFGDNGVLIKAIDNSTSDAVKDPITGAIQMRNAVIITLDSSIEAATVGMPTKVSAGSAATFERTAYYEVVLPAIGPTTELRWHPHGTTDYQVISRHVDTTDPYLFSYDPTDSHDTATGIKWSFRYAADTGTSGYGNMLKGKSGFYLGNRTMGILMPRADDPPPINQGEGLTYTAPTSSSTTSVTTSATTSSIPTTTKSTTSTTPTTTSSTTIKATTTIAAPPTTASTTKASTTSSTTKASTTKTTTTTAKSTTSTKASSTTAKSTSSTTSTKASTTTAKSTSSTTSTKASTTTAKSTSTTTSTKATTTTTKATTSASTTKATTSSTTTSTTSTKPTTTTSTTSSTVKTTTTSIPVDY